MTSRVRIQDNECTPVLHKRGNTQIRYLLTIAFLSEYFQYKYTIISLPSPEALQQLSSQLSVLHPLLPTLQQDFAQLGSWPPQLLQLIEDGLMVDINRVGGGVGRHHSPRDWANPHFVFLDFYKKVFIAMKTFVLNLESVNV